MRLAHRTNHREASAPRNLSGHSMFCAKCRTFRVHEFALDGNGTPALASRCHACGTTTVYRFAAGGWVPESFMETLDAFASDRITLGINAIKDDAEKTGESVPTVLAASKGGRLRAWLTCRRYSLIAIPAAGLLLFEFALGWLAYRGVYLSPLKEWLAAIWQPWMDNELFMWGSLALGAGLVATAVACGIKSRKREGTEHRESEHDLLREMEDF